MALEQAALSPSELALGKAHLEQAANLQVGEAERFQVFLPNVAQFQAGPEDHALTAVAAQVHSVQPAEAEAGCPVRQGRQDERASYSPS